MPERLRPAAFLDRDGTLIEERDYLSDPDDVRLLPGAAAAVRALAHGGLAVVLVTNQSGIARGLYGEPEFRAVQARLETLLAEEGAALEATYHCPHHPDFTGPCDCRKPATGLYLRAATELRLDLARSWYVGDKPSDVAPARALGGRGVLVRTGYGAEAVGEVGPGVAVVADFPAAAAHILEARRRLG